ncbi:MAG: hypothetical protein A3B68_09160 [Candidatus Melainabacteria bacterium RIFCSPHIGHO2_02_FULL_34_12]|nr:MAG: hypothetical protein A3B68_09160 [Candidatus Melainabacteria bacterium RIFCSPHIGHO2_02_FULL_34_12]
MITEEQKYFSGILRNLGFAFLAPIGSIMFQTIVFKKSPLDGYVFWAVLILLLGCLFFYLGYIPIKEKK